MEGSAGGAGLLNQHALDFLSVQNMKLQPSEEEAALPLCKNTITYFESK